MKAANTRLIEPERHHDQPDVERRRIGGHDHLEAQQRVKRDVEEKAREHRRDRRRALGMRVRQPGMERRQADLGAIADQQEHEGERKQFRIEFRRVLPHQVPRHRRQALAQHLLRGEIDQDGAEERERDADRAEDEVLPRRLDRLRRAVDADHHHRGQRRHLDADPEQADIVGDQRHVHRAEHGLIERVVEAQEASASAGRSRARGRCSSR